MDKLQSLDFWKAALARAVWTIAQTMLAMLTIGMSVQEVDWLRMLSVGAVAGVYSLLKSIVAGIPEMQEEIVQEETIDK